MITNCILHKRYKRDILQPYSIKNKGHAPQKIVENNHTPIIDAETWSATQAEIKRRNSLRSTTTTGKGRYDWRYAFSGLLFCGDCGTAFRRHNYKKVGGNAPIWTCKQHIISAYSCPQMPVKEKTIEDAFIQTLNRLKIDRAMVRSIVIESVAEVLGEPEVDSEGTEASEIMELDLAIEQAQADMIALSKKRAKGEIDGAEYTKQSGEVMAKLDDLFLRRENLTKQLTTGALSKTHISGITEFLDSGEILTEFDKDTFLKLVSSVIIHSREEMEFEFKDGTRIRADL